MNTLSLRPAIRLLTIRPLRTYAVQAPGVSALEVFSAQNKLLQRERAASNVELSRQVDYLRDEVAARLCERLLDIKRDFPHVLDYGANACNVARILTKSDPDDYSSKPVHEPISKRIQKLTSAESSPGMLYRDQGLEFNNGEMEIVREVMKFPETLPFEQNTFDAVLSSMSLHWINDLPSVLKQINGVLKEDSPFIGVMLGGDSLYELRTSLQLADLDRRGGVTARVSPLADVRDVGGLLQGAGFKLLTVDVDDIVIDYPDMFALIQDLQAMGESNAILARETAGIRRDVLAAANAIYKELHGNEDGESVPATFRLIYMIGWKEGKSQQKPLERGSGMVSIKDVLEGRVKMPEDDQK
jgi:NADH dehydrogenase [ubiquinone] 1 alpha subcomplex assembly factor 5